MLQFYFYRDCQPIGDINVNDNNSNFHDKKADILQANFEHYYRMAMDHHTKAGTTSQILLVIVGAILVLVGYDKDICSNPIDIVSALFVILIGLFGAVWAATQIARYRYWEYIALSYQKEMKKIFPEFKTRRAYKHRAEIHSGTTYPNFHRQYVLGPIKIGPIKLGRCIGKIKDRYLWVILHLVVVFMGLVLLGIASLRTCS
jgi:hypothetical protein